MTTRAIGIDFDGTILRAVVLQVEKGSERLLHAARIPWDGSAPLAPLLAGVGVIPAVGDRVTTALPPAIGLTRTLTFPFSDRRKVATAIPLELAALLPIPLDDCVIAQQEAIATGSGVSVVAAAVPAIAVAQLVGPFDAAGIPLQTVDLLPFALATGLTAELGDGLALCLSHGWGTILHLVAGRLHDYRVLPFATDLPPEERAAQLQRELTPLLHASRSTTLRLFGAQVDNALLLAVQSAYPQVAVTAVQAGGGGASLGGEFLPALALARRGTRSHSDGFNFRRGAFSRHGESDALRSRLLVLIGVVIAAVLILSVSAGVRWWSKAQGAEALKQELITLYRQAIPGQGAVVDVTLQLRAHLGELTRRSRPGGQHPLQRPAAIMREVSNLMPRGIPVTLREWNITPEEIRIEAHAPSFEAADKIAAALAASPLFKTVQVTDAKNSADNSRVDFRLTLTSTPAEELP
jgi:general secretion pathway protein L